MRTHTLVLFVLAAMIMSGQLYSLRAAENPSLYVLPFRVVGPDQTEVIQNGIEAFLTSRLSSDVCPLAVTSRTSHALSTDTTLTPTQALELLQKLNGDSLIYGTVIRFGDSLTTDAFLYDRTLEKIVVHFHDMGKGDGALLDHLTRFSDQVILRLSSPCFPDMTPARTASAQRPDKTPFSSLSVWKSPMIKEEVTGIVVCDLGGDGTLELVAAHEHSLTVFTLGSQAMPVKTSFNFPRQGHIVGIDSADINRNGQPEIYVSSIQDDRHTISSRVLEWSNGSFQIVKSDLPLLFRRLNGLDESTALILAQKNKNLSSLLGTAISSFDINPVTKSNPLPLASPESGINLYAYTFARDRQGTSYATFAFNHRIRVYDSNLTLQWESDEDFGGSDRFMAMDDPHDRDKQLHVFLEPRLLFLDLDNDGINELISVKNKETANHLFSGYRHFSNGQIVIFKRNDFGFAPIFETDKVTGHIIDFTVQDVDGDGTVELIYAVSQPGKGIFSDKTAFIVVQKLKIH